MREQPAVCCQGRRCLGSNKHSSGDVGGWRYCKVNRRQCLPNTFIVLKSRCLKLAFQIPLPMRQVWNVVPATQLSWGQPRVFNATSHNVKQFCMQLLNKGLLTVADCWMTIFRNVGLSLRHKNTQFLCKALLAQSFCSPAAAWRASALRVHRTEWTVRTEIKYNTQFRNVGSFFVSIFSFSSLTLNHKAKQQSWHIP